jgi:hypothetical protein
LVSGERQQVPVRRVQLEQIEAGASAPVGGGPELLENALQVRLGHLTRDLAHPGKVG